MQDIQFSAAGFQLAAGPQHTDGAAGGQFLHPGGIGCHIGGGGGQHLLPGAAEGFIAEFFPVVGIGGLAFVPGCAQGIVLRYGAQDSPDTSPVKSRKKAGMAR